VKDLLRVPAFGRLLAAYTLNEVAYSVGSLALTVLVYRYTHSALAAAGYFLCAQFVPALISPLLVARIDARPPSIMLPLLYGAEVLVFLALVVLAGSFTLAGVLVLTLVDGTMAVAARSLARAASVGVLAPVGKLQEGNALLNGSFTVCFMLAPAAAGGLVAGVGIRATLIVAAGLFALVAVSLIGTRGLPRAPDAAQRGAARLRRALAYVRGAPAVRTPLVLQGLAMVAFAISIPVEIVFVQHSLHDGSAAYGALVSLWGAGAVVGSLLYARWRRGQPRALVAGSAAALGSGFLIMALAPSLPVALVGAALAGAGNGVEAVAARTLVQLRTDPDWMGLVMALNESMMQASPGGGIVIGGAVAALAGPRSALGAAAAGSVLTAIGAWVLLAPGRQGQGQEEGVGSEAVEAAEPAARAG
jgi:predicted MFS family arabinose efflux permease